MIEFINSILGEYEAISFVYQVGEDTADIIPSGMAGVDWPYMIGAIAFLIMLYSIFRIIGIFIDKL